MNRVDYTGRLLFAAALAAMAGTAHANCAVEAGYPETTPDSDFADAGNGTVRHIPTGLVWKRCAEGESWTGATCTGTPATYSWEQAFARVDAVNGGTQGENAGQSDWRLPNSNELKSLSEMGCINPAINTTQFPTATASSFWSSTPVAGSSNNAWFVVLTNGDDSHTGRDVANQVRLVRAGESLYDFDAAAPEPSAVPTLSAWGVGLLSLLLTAFGLRKAGVRGGRRQG